ncbi:type I-C CRISPR-associated protein Cas8c/Csd1 [Paracidobacterium acidisoli]|uniref:type I-C CRISPR-associated protein Cas8c/Csd1 n=1 Tax=Paracidobacterium acidisoli TaxID=2303751 RepID=UPI00131406CE|nr:type I-C CRISPR-associated protein Cas8c/Csd1 [Paracidobacterium acidisoli]
MILHELRELARREGLVDDPAFESKPVRWIIVLDEDGSYLSLRDTEQEVPLPEGKKGKPKRQASMYGIPRRMGRTSKAVPDFLVDKSEYVLGAEPDDKRSMEDLKARRKLFADLLNEAAESAQSEAGKAVSKFLANDAERERCASEIAERGYAGNDLLTFRVDGAMLHDDETLRTWWRQRGASGTTENAAITRQCLLCGESRPSVDKHDALQIAGAVTSGVSLVTFNSAAFEKYGLERNDNAPICRECMTAYVEGLRRLINSRYISARTGDPVTPQNVRLTGDTTAVYWANVQDELTSLLSELMYSPQKVRDLLNSPHRGQHSSSANERFFCLIISGAQGRAMLRSMHTGTLSDLEKNLNRYFDAIRLEGDRGEPKPLGFLLRSLVLQGKLDRLPPRLAGEVFFGILFGEKLPQLVLSAAVQRNRAEQKVTPERAALLQLFFASHQQKEVPLMSLDAQSTDAPYRLGRLLSTYEQLQRRAQGGNLNRTLVDRYFGAASTRPGTVFPQLVRLSQNHLGKLGPAGGFYQSLITGIVDGIDNFPAMLTLEEQGRFALGYYHQRQSFFRSNKKEENDATEPTTDTSEGENIQ